MSDTLKKQEFFLCECGTEGMMVGVDVDLYDNDTRFTRHFDFSYWQYGMNPGRLPFWQRVKLAWRVIWKRSVFADQVIIDNATAWELTAFLTSHLAESPKSKVYSDDR